MSSIPPRVKAVCFFFFFSSFFFFFFFLPAFPLSLPSLKGRRRRRKRRGREEKRGEKDKSSKKKKKEFRCGVRPGSTQGQELKKPGPV